MLDACSEIATQVLNTYMTKINKKEDKTKKLLTAVHLESSSYNCKVYTHLCPLINVRETIQGFPRFLQLIVL